MNTKRIIVYHRVCNYKIVVHDLMDDFTSV